MSQAGKGKTPLNKCPIFILGAPRTGTTWLLELLVAHPDTFHLNSQSLGLEMMESDWPGIASKETQLFWKCDPAGAFRRVTRAQSKRGKRGVEKTPSHVFHLLTISELWPLARPIVIYRNPWDSVVSMIEASKTWSSWAPSTIEEAALRWNHFVSPVLEYKGRLTEVMYVDLKEETSKHLDKILKEQSLMSTKELRTKMIEKVKDGKSLKNMRGFFRKGIVGDYKNKLTKKEWKVVYNITQPNFSKIVKRFPSAEKFLVI